MGNRGWSPIPKGLVVLPPFLVLIYYHYWSMSGWALKPPPTSPLLLLLCSSESSAQAYLCLQAYQAVLCSGRPFGYLHLKVEINLLKIQGKSRVFSFERRTAGSILTKFGDFFRARGKPAALCGANDIACCTLENFFYPG